MNGESEKKDGVRHRKRTNSGGTPNGTSSIEKNYTPEQVEAVKKCVLFMITFYAHNNNNNFYLHTINGKSYTVCYICEKMLYHSHLENVQV
jgi:hypothetical protein